jgi:hypothetical protein
MLVKQAWHKPPPDVVLKSNQKGSWPEGSTTCTMWVLTCTLLRRQADIAKTTSSPAEGQQLARQLHVTVSQGFGGPRSSSSRIHTCTCITNHFFSLIDTTASASAILLQQDLAAPAFCWGHSHVLGRLSHHKVGGSCCYSYYGAPKAHVSLTRGIVLLAHSTVTLLGEWLHRLRDCICLNSPRKLGT